MNLPERGLRLISTLRVLLIMNVLVRMGIPRLRVAPRQVPVRIRRDRRRQLRPVTPLEAHVLVRMILVSTSVAVLGITALQHAPGPRTTTRWRTMEQHVLVRVLLALIVTQHR